jgi:hypothetical protein
MQLRVIVNIDERTDLYRCLMRKRSLLGFAKGMSLRTLSARHLKDDRLRGKSISANANNNDSH